MVQSPKAPSAVVTFGFDADDYSIELEDKKNKGAPDAEAKPVGMNNRGNGSINSNGSDVHDPQLILTTGKCAQWDAKRLLLTATAVVSTAVLVVFVCVRASTAGRELSTSQTTPSMATRKSSTVALAATESVTADWSLRLSEPAKKRGVLEIFHGGSWGAVCTRAPCEHCRWIAEIACRTFGYSTGDVQSDDGEPVYKYVTQDLLCDGSEASLAACNHNRVVDPNQCDGGAPLVVQCITVMKAANF